MSGTGIPDTWEDIQEEAPSKPLSTYTTQAVANPDDLPNNADVGSPVLLVDISKLSGCGRGDLSPEERNELLERLVVETGKAFRSRSAHLFAIGAAYHSTMDRADGDLADLEDILDHDMVIIPFPQSLAGYPTHLLWDAVTRDTGIESVDAIKELVREAQADLLWKADMAVEIEKLAAKEQADSAVRESALMKAMQLREEIDNTSQQVALRSQSQQPPAELEALRRRLAALQFELERQEDIALDMEHELPDGEMSLVEILLKVILERHPIIAEKGIVSENMINTHYIQIQTQQQELIEAWERHFGRLPRASRALVEAVEQARR